MSKLEEFLGLGAKKTKPEPTKKESNSIKEFDDALDKVNIALRKMYKDFPGLDKEIRNKLKISGTPQRVIDQLSNVVQFAVNLKQDRK